MRSGARRVRAPVDESGTAPRRQRRAEATPGARATTTLKFQRLAGELRRGILAGEWAPGAKLPTEVQLTIDSGLSLTTVRRAFDELVQQGYVVRRQGAGSFAALPRTYRRTAHVNVGVLIPDTRLYYPRVLQGIEDSLSEAGIGLQLAAYHYNLPEEQHDIDFLLASETDGLLLVPTLAGIDDPAARVNELMGLRIPAVLVERRLLGAGPDDRSEYVCSDHPAGAYDAVLHLYGLGHRKIAFVARSHNPTVEAVSLGFDKAIADLGLSDPVRLMARNVEWDSERADGFVQTLMDSGVSCALVFSDREASMIEAAAQRADVRVPEQLALVSYDDETADLAEVPLTAVAPPKYRVGRMAADVLIRRMTEGDACPVHQIRLRPRIVVRQSCGAMPAVGA